MPLRAGTKSAKTSVAGRAHGATPQIPGPAQRQYRPQLAGLIHPEAVRAIQTVFDNLYTLRSQVQTLADGTAASSSGSASTSSSSTTAASSSGSGDTGSSAGTSGGSTSVGGSSDQSSSSFIGNIQGINISANTSNVEDGATLSYNASIGQFEIANGSSGVNDVTASRTFGTAYQNTTGSTIYVSGYGQITGGSGDSQISCLVGLSSPSTTVWAMTCSFTIPGEPCGFAMVVPPNYYYAVHVVHDISTTPVSWIETTL